MAIGGKNRIEVDIIANDKSSRVYTDVAKSVRNMASSINNSINTMNAGLSRYNSAMQSLNRSTQIAVAGAGYLIYRFTKDSIQQFAEFERQHGKTMGAIASNYDKTIEAQRRFLQDQKKLKEDSLRLGTVGPTGKGSLYNPTQISQAQTALAKAGVKQDQIPIVLNPVLKFAGGNDLPMETAADFAVNMGTMFKIPKEKWGDMLDKMSRAADISTIDVPDLFESMKYAGGITSSMKRPFEEVLSMVSIMGNAGLKGSMAGTGIQAFFTRLLNPIGITNNALEKAPSDYSAKMMESFIASTTTPDGKFKSMPEVTEMLDKVMGSLTDKEQAWFAYKLFGLFQMKAGFMLGKNGGASMQDVINDLNGKAPGTNDRKWDIMLQTSWGRQTALANAMYGIKTDVGYRLSPVTNAITDELFRVLTDRSNYKIDFTRLHDAINEASGMMTDQYGSQIGELVKNVATLGVNGGRVLAANEPLLEGVGVGVSKILGGDIVGAFDAVSRSVERANKNISNLPPELQGMAEQVRNAALALAAISGINFTAKLAESLTTIWRVTLGKLPMMNVATTTMYVNTGVLNKDGKPIYRETDRPGGGGSGGSGGAPVLVGADGKPVSSGEKPVLVDKDGRPLTSSGSKPTGAGKLAKSGLSRGIGIASWAYALGEMFGWNDKILDGLGVKGGARDAVDKGRTALNWGLSASAIDSWLLKGAGRKAILSGASGLSGLASSVGIPMGLALAPFALGGGAMLAQYNWYQNGQRNMAAGANGNYVWDAANKKVVPIQSFTDRQMGLSADNRVSNMNQMANFMRFQPPAMNVDVRAPIVNVDVRVDKEGNVSRSEYTIDYASNEAENRKYRLMQSRIGG